MGAVLSCLAPTGGGTSFPSDRASVGQELLSLTRRGEYHRLKALFDTLTETSHDFNAHRGLYVNCRDKHGRTPLILASKYGNHAIAELFVSLGADLDLSHGSGRMTALHTSVAYRRTSIATLLVQSGASPFIENASGLTPHDMVIRTGLSLELLRLMETRGLYAGWVEQRVSRLRRPWARRWSVVTQRLQVAASGGAPRVRVVLCLYEHLSTFWSPCRVWVDGSRASGTGTLVELELAGMAGKPKGACCKKVGGRWVLEFRASGTDAASREALEEFKACLNWGASLGLEGQGLGVGMTPSFSVQPVVVPSVESSQHWASQPPGFLTGPEVSGMSLTSTASYDSDTMIPAAYTIGSTDAHDFTTNDPNINPNANTSTNPNTIPDTNPNPNPGTQVLRECLICLDRPVDIVFTHADGVGCAVACAECNARFQSTVCPVCRRQISSRVKVYGL